MSVGFPPARAAVRGRRRAASRRSRVFRLAIEAADVDADGIGIAAGALLLNGGSIRDLAGNPANLDLGRHAIVGAPGHAVDGGGANPRD